MRASALLAGCLAVGACGGGGSSAPPPSPPPAPPPPPPAPPTGGGETPAHCRANDSGAFRNVTSELGLCYEVEAHDDGADEIPLQGGGIALADIDGDGRLELYVSHGRFLHGRLFRFDGERFQPVDDSGIATTGIDQAAYFVDVDEDGWRDLVSAQADGVEIFLNDRAGGFLPNGETVNIDNSRATTSMAAADYDSDGDVDLFFGHWGTGHAVGQTEFLWEQKGGGTFADVTYRVPVAAADGVKGESEYTFTPVFADFDGDGDPDLLLASDFRTSQVLMNHAGGDAFLDLTSAVISDENGMGGAVADYDRDGDLDWFVSSIWDAEVPGNWTGNRLYRNADGQGTFEDATDEAGVRRGGWGWGACFADFDNDGHVDLFHTNGYPEDGGGKFEEDPSVLFMAAGDGTFVERAAELGLDHTDQGRGVACADYDDDGKVDIFIANNGKSPTVFRNVFASGNGYLAIALRGLAGNPDAIGARVVVATASGRQMNEVRLGQGYLSHGPQTLHFGLGDAGAASFVEVSWPGPEPATSRLENVAANRLLVIEHPRR